MILIKNVVEVTDIIEQSYPRIPYPTKVEDWNQPPFNNLLKQASKDCGVGQRKGGRVALAPQGNELVEELKGFFDLLKYDTVYFADGAAIDDYIQQEGYTGAFTNTTRKQLCMGIVFDEYEKLKYSYSLRYNISGPDAIDDHWDTDNTSNRIRFKVDDLPYFLKILTNGMLTLQFLIEGFIIRKETTVQDTNFAVQKMKTPAYLFADYQTTLETPIIITFIIAALVAYLRLISLIVNERQNRNIENMESMGMKKSDYIFAAITFSLTVQFVVGLIISIILSTAVLTNTNFFVLFFTYLLFVYTILMVGLIISSFFINAKKAVIAGLIVFFVLYLFSLLRDTLKNSGTTATTIVALSPIGGLSQIIVNFLKFENTNFNFGFSDLGTEIFNFKGQTFFIICIIELIIFFLLGLYFFYVIPLSIGIAKHPLFCFGSLFSKKKKRNQIDFEKSESQIFREDNDFEEVEEEFLAQREERKTIKIDNLTKIFGNGKVAVDHLNIEMFSNQIFALLGHNGAGKTTTISMISGFLHKTSGSINIHGLDSIVNKDEVKSLIGVCPQTNPIFNFMTVAEHLRLYATLKGVEGDIEEEIDSVLNDIDLLNKKDYPAKNLSGGQKRKLCIAIAFIGGSKIILLDEPTSGMDTYARRLLWEMVKKYKQDRLIILTTHNMDEADYLGDRIGIMSEGKMITCGSSLYLKNKFGVGYDLTIVKEQNIRESDSDKIQEEIVKKVEDAILTSNVGTEMKFRLPLKNLESFSDLFKMLEENGKRLKIESFGVGLTTLEEVFLNIAANKDDDIEEDVGFNKANFDEPLLNRENNENNVNLKNDSLEDKDLEELRMKSSSSIFLMQMKGLMKKRFIYFSRDIGGLICEVFLPIIIVIIGLSLTKINFVKDPSYLDLTPDVYGNDFYINKYAQYGQSDDISRFMKKDIPSEFVLDSATKTAFDNDIYDRRSDEQTMAYFIESYNQSRFNYTVFFNVTAPYSVYIGINDINNAILKQFSGNDDAYIKMSLKPFGQTSGVKSIEDIIDGQIIVFLLGLAFSFIPASLIVYIIKERELNAKHQQLISGASILAYWLTNFIIDFVKYLIPATVTVLLLIIYDVKFFLKDERASMTILLLLFFGLAMISSVYLISFAFKKPSSGQITIFLIAFISSFVLVILSFVLKLIVDTRSFTVNFLEYILRLNPFFALPYGLLNMASITFYTFIFAWDENNIPGAYDSRVSLNDLIFMIVMSFFFIILITIIENTYTINLTKEDKNAYQQVMTPDNDIETPEENDVLLETERVNSEPERYSVRVNNLTKVYGRNANRKVAVKNITFGVESGSVFGLLGTNGAGKTSTFKVLTGDLRPTSGSAFIMNRPMPAGLTKIRHLVGYCPQFDTILPNLTAIEHLELYVKLKGVDPKFHTQLIDEAITNLNLEKYKNVRAGTFSGGNKRKLSVAIAMIGKPPIIFLDEPSSGMDPQARRFMWGIINEYSTLKKHSSIVLTTHSMEEAEALSTKLAIMVEGEIKTIGSVQQLKNKYGKCFELEMKISLISQEELKERVRGIRERVEFKDGDKLVKSDLENILGHLNKDNLIEEIEENKKGAYINQQLESRKFVSLKVFLEWIDIVEKFKEIGERLEAVFGAEILETYQSFSRFKLDPSAKLSEIFRFLEDKKEELFIVNYSVKQISLEQIFIQFAKYNKEE